MENYEILNQLGDGTFGCVVKALHKKTGQLVAIKKMKQKYYSWEECVKLPEVVVVRRIHGHPNIVKMREVIRENNELFFVFEYMDGDLLGVIRKAKQMQNLSAVSTSPPLGYPKIKSYTFQILQSLAYLHRRGYFHRDMKPENLLIKKDTASTPQEIIKLADFGLVKEIRARPPFTDYVSTRWYRAPELLLQDRAYSSPVDIWAAGCILAELITTRPLFAGSNEVDQLHKIMSVLGSPTEQTWPEGMTLAKKIRYSFPVVKGVGLERVLPTHLPPQALDLMKQMLNYDPKKRPTAQQCLQHPYFNVGVDEVNFATPSAAKQLANAAKKYAPSPQSAPSGNSGSSPKCNTKRSPVGATTALPKQTGVTNGLSFAPQQKLYPPIVSKANVINSEKSQISSISGASLPSIGLENSVQSKNVLPKLPISSLNKIKSTSPGVREKDDVDLDGLMNEFAGELETLGLLSQKKQETTYSAFGGSTKKPSPIQEMNHVKPLEAIDTLTSSPSENNLVATLLSSTRYKKSSFQGTDSGVPLHSLGKLPLQHKEPLPLKSPTVGGGHHTVSPSVKALLAKHREGGFHSMK